MCSQDEYLGVTMDICAFMVSVYKTFGIHPNTIMQWLSTKLETNTYRCSPGRVSAPYSMLLCSPAIKHLTISLYFHPLQVQSIAVISNSTWFLSWRHEVLLSEVGISEAVNNHVYRDSLEAYTFHKDYALPIVPTIVRMGTCPASCGLDLFGCGCIQHHVASLSLCSSHSHLQGLEKSLVATGYVYLEAVSRYGPNSIRNEPAYTRTQTKLDLQPRWRSLSEDLQSLDLDTLSDLQFAEGTLSTSVNNTTVSKLGKMFGMLISELKNRQQPPPPIEPQPTVSSCMFAMYFAVFLCCC
jgi:hypothetical protein